jgi:hypothetical protein
MLKQKVLQAAGCLLCAYLTIRDPYGLSGSEFSGGRLTGRLLDLKFVGFFLFVVALLLAFVFPRIAAVTALISSLCCLPLYFYFVVPGLFRRIFKGFEWSVPLKSYFVADRWALANILALLLVIGISVQTLWRRSKKRPSQHVVQTEGARAPRA